MKKFLTEAEKLQGYALYVMACKHYEKAREFEEAIAKLMGDDEKYNDHVSDAIYSNDPGNADTWDSVLDNAGIQIRKPARRKAKR